MNIIVITWQSGVKVWIEEGERSLRYILDSFDDIAEVELIEPDESVRAEASTRQTDDVVDYLLAMTERDREPKLVSEKETPTE